MNAKGLLSCMILCIIIQVSSGSKSIAQRASAEFISTMLPMKLETGEQVRDGIQHLFYKDQRIYVTNVWAGMQVIDVSNVEQPVELGAFRSDARSHNVFVQDHYAYLSNELGGISILDVSNPKSIVQAGHIETEEDAFWVVADYPYVFIAEQENGISVYDISLISSPVFVTTYEATQWPWALFLYQNSLFVADKTGGVLILDVSNPANPVKLGQYSQMKYTKNIYVENDIAYVANGPDGLSILDVSNPRFPKLISKLVVDGFVNDAQRSGNAVFLANELKRRLEIVDVSDLSNPVKVAEYETEGKIYSASKYDVYVFVAADKQTILLRFNNPPVIAEIEDQSMDETQTLSITAQGSDLDDDPIYYQVENLPEGAVFDSLSGNLVWVPTYEQSGTYPNIRIFVIERTASALSASTEFNITVNHVNRNPVLPDVPDGMVDENQTITFTIPEGSDPDREDQGKLVYLAENLPEGASFDPASRKFTWTPTFEQSGVYMVDFVVQDPPGAIMRDGATITVSHVDRKPVIEPIAAQSVNENETLTFTVKGSDPDKEDQDKLRYTAQNLPEGAVFDASTATFTWTPTYDQYGVYNNLLFIFTAGALKDSALADITVNHVNRPPVLAAVTDKTVDENMVLRFTIYGSDPDVEDGGKLSYKAANLPAGARFSPDSLLFTWTPTHEQSGTYQDISFTVTDPGGLSDSKSNSITVNHVNRPPVLADVPPQSVDENTMLSLALQGSDPDREDEGKLIYSAKGLPAGAILDGPVLSWTPNYDQSGVYTLTFTVSDGNLTYSTNTTITVNHVNRTPALADIPEQTVDENKALSFTVSGSDPDKEDNGLCKLSSGTLPVGAEFDATTGRFTWTPGFDQSGSYTLTFMNTDPQGLSTEKTVTVTVNHVNRTPEFPIQPDLVVAENTTLTHTLTAATDPDAEDTGKLVYTVANLPEGAQFDAQSLVLTWTPTYEQSGVYTVEFSVNDAEFTVVQPLKVTVTHVNRPPVLEAIAAQTINENEEWLLTVAASDPDKEDAGKLVLGASALPEGAVFNAQKAMFSWTPTYEQSGTYPDIKVTVTDAMGLSDEKTFDIVVNHVNRAPSLAAPAPVTGIENSPLTLQLAATDPDQEDQGKLVYSARDLPSGAVLDSQTGLVSWTPDFLQAGEYSLTVKVTDTGGLSAEQKAVLTVNDLNRPPELAPVGAQSVNENENLTFTLTATDMDEDNTLVFTTSGIPQGAQFDAATREFRWTPGFDQAGSYTVGFTVSDGKEEASAEAAITVANVNRLPVFKEIGPQRVDENANLNFTIEAVDEDAGTTLTYSASGLPEGATFDEASRQFSWTPTFEQAGSYPVIFTVSDGEGEVSMTTELTVNNVNRKPQMQPVEPQTVNENEALSFSVTATDEDAGAALNYSVKNLPAGAQFENQTFTWIPGFDQAGQMTVILVVSDGEDEVEQPVQLTVNNVNRAPEISGPQSEDVRAGTTVTLSYSGTDPDKDALEFSGTGLPDGARIDAKSGTFSWTPAGDQVGKAEFTVKVSDGAAEAEMKTTINVRMPEPEAPPAPPDTTQGN